MASTLFFCFSNHNKTSTYGGSSSGKNPWGKLVLKVTKSIVSMHNTFLVLFSGQRSLSALMISTSSVLAEMASILIEVIK